MKYLFVESEMDSDFGKLTFVENVKDNLTELWQKVWSNKDHKLNYTLKVQEEADDVYEIEYELKADNLDEHTVSVMQELIDYDVDKAYGWIKAE